MSAPHPYASIDDALVVVQAEARGLPPIDQPHVCPYCFGAKGPSYPQCYGCLMMLRSGVSSELLQRVVPISMAPDPGAWYSRMQRYKGASPDDMYLLAAAAYAAFAAWRVPMEEFLEGPVDAVCITPSTRGIAVEDQRLWKALRLVREALPPISPILSWVAGQQKPRNAINPALFTADLGAIRGRRIVLVEDTWVTGSGALAAATALTTRGAAGILVLPIARRLETDSIARVHGADYMKLVEPQPWRAENLRWPR